MIFSTFETGDDVAGDGGRYYTYLQLHRQHQADILFNVAYHSRYTLADLKQKVWLMNALWHGGIAFCAFTRTSEMKP
jgi:hypothetical protein